MQETISYNTSVEPVGGVIMNERRPNIGLVTTFGYESGHTPLLNLVKILSSLSDKLYVLGPNAIIQSSGNIQLHSIGYNLGKGILAQVANQISFQLRMSYQLARLTGKVKLWVFFGGESLLFPMLITKLFRGKVALALAGYLEREAEFRKNVLYKPLILLKRINCRLADRIVIYSQRFIKEWRLERHNDKIAIAHEHFVDFSRFKEEKPLKERDNLVGYIGRLSQEKGILNFIEAIPKVMETGDKATFLVVGAGPLRSQVEECAGKLNNRVKFVRWVPHDKIPDYLNELKLLVVPSYTEGLPNIMLEAMACGTPILATPVGAIPDFIKDGETGFIISNALPLCLADDIERALNHPSLARIASNVKKLVEKEFTYEAAIERYNRIINDLVKQ